MSCERSGHAENPENRCYIVRVIPEANRSYVSIVRWPEGWDEARCAMSFAGSTGTDAYSAKRAARLATPSVVARLEPGPAQAAAAGLRAEGVVAYAIPHADIARLYDPPVVRRLSPPQGGTFAADLGHGVVGELDPARVVLLVRGQVRQASRREPPGGTNPSVFTRRLSESPPGDYAMMEAMGDAAGPRPNVRTDVFELLDVHMKPGSCLRIEGGVFDWSCLGAERAESNRENCDRLAVRLARVVQSRGGTVIVDTGFARAGSILTAVTDFLRNSTPKEASGRGGRVAFGVYSAWTACLLRAEISESRGA